MSKFGGYTVDGVPQKEEKNWGLQALVLFAIGLLFVVPWVVVTVLIMHGHHPMETSGAYHDRSTHASVALIAGIVVLDVVMLIVLAVRMARQSRN